MTLSKDNLPGVGEARSLLDGPFDQSWHERWTEFTAKYDPFDYVLIFSAWRYRNPFGDGYLKESPFDNKSFKGTLLGDTFTDNRFQKELIASWPAAY